MKLAAIFCVWSDWDIFEHAYKNIKPLVDDVLIIASPRSNFGEIELIPAHIERRNTFLFDPDPSIYPATNERAKRNFALDKAREQGYTHFIMLDADEVYEAEPFLKEKQRFIDNPDLKGLVCGLKCYFKLPTLSVSDKTLVPFIHKLTPDLKFEWNPRYPFAFEAVKRDIRIDPTRQMNITDGVEWSDIVMFHYSYIRSDLRKKIRNSTARQNIENSTLIEDYKNAKAGYFCKFYNSVLTEEENKFNIPEIIDKEILGIN